jgi:hypothetical protein
MQNIPTYLRVALILDVKQNEGEWQEIISFVEDKNMSKVLEYNHKIIVC